MWIENVAHALTQRCFLSPLEYKMGIHFHLSKPFVM